MARKKVKLEYIENENARKVTYKKRVKGVVKKTEELSVLCGVDACAVIYSPYEPAPVVWPSSEEEVRRIVSAYRRTSDFDHSERQFNQATYLKQSVQKANERLMRLQRRNRELEMENLATNIMTGRITLQQVPPCDLGDLLWVLEDKLRTIQHRIRVIEGGNNNDGNMNPISPTTVSTNSDVGANSISNGGGSDVTD